MTLELLAAALLVALLGCAAGTVMVNPDGSCEVRGVAFGRSELAAYRLEGSSVRTIDDTTEITEEHALCARVGGGAGSSASWAAVGAVFGAFFGALPALL